MMKALVLEENGKHDLKVNLAEFGLDFGTVMNGGGLPE